MKFRVGHGYDVHKLVEDRKLIIGGVEIPHYKGLLGHSDADVLAHAICDAGKHFPDNDDRYKDIDSLVLLEKVCELIRNKGYEISNVDSTILAQAPKLRPYIDEMRSKLAKAMKLDIDELSVKATTEERLGFTGREEGIAAHAVVLLMTI